MGKSIGSASIAASFDVLADAPLDSRTVVDLKADLTASGTFDYKYVGMPVYVKSEQKTYTLIGNDPTDIGNWKEIGSGGSGGSAELEENVTTNTAAGAIEVGTTLPQGMTFTQFVKALTIAEVDPTINFSISQGGTVPSGSSYTETLTCAVTNMGSSKKIKTISWYEGETLKRTDNVNSTVPATWTYTMPTATTDTTTFKAVVTYTSSKDIDISVEKTDTITFGSYKYYGEVFSLDPTEQEVLALTEVAGNSRAGQYSFTFDDSRICYAYPKSFGALTKITDPYNNNLMYSFTRTEQTYTIGGQSVDYYRYVLTDEAGAPDFVITFE